MASKKSAVAICAAAMLVAPVQGLASSYESSAGTKAHSAPRSNPAAMEFNVDGDVTASWDDNLSQAWLDQDVIENNSYQASLTLGARKLVNPRLMLAGGLLVEHEAMDDVDTLDRTSAGFRGSARWQPTNGYLAPVYEFNIRMTSDDYETDARDSETISTQLLVSRRFTDRILGTVGMQHRKRVSDGSVWDLEDSRVFVNVDYTFRGNLSLYTTLSAVKGDQFSSAQRTYCNGASATAILPLIQIATAIESDDAFNEAFCGDWLAYRFDAKSTTAVLGANYGFGHALSVDASYLYADVVSDENDDVSYEREMFRLSVLKRF